MRSVRRLRLSLASQILVFQLAIVLGALILGAAASYLNESRQLDQRYEQRSLNIARSVAGMPSVGDGLRDSDPSRTLQPLAEGIRKASGASFVVIAGANGIRYSHPNASMIGKPIDEDYRTVLAGHTWVGVEHGTLGVSARGKAPIFDGQNRVIGIVSVGFLEGTLSEQLAAMLPQLAFYLLVALALGVAGSLLLARRLKRQTFGLEPGEIASLLETREASLHGIREGTVATDVDGRITLINDEACRLLRLSSGSVGQRLTDVLPPGRVRDLLIGEVTGADEVVLAADRVLVVSRMPVVVRGRTIGHVATFRDRTELEGLLRELDNARSVSEALRAQAHDFSNRLHTIAGLIELGRYEEAIQLTTESSSVSQELTEALLERVGDPVLGALLLGKSAVAAERGIQFRLSPDITKPGGWVILNADDRWVAALARRVRANVAFFSVEGDRSVRVRRHLRTGPGTGQTGGGPSGRRGDGREPRWRGVHRTPAARRQASPGANRMIRTLIVDDDFRVAGLHRAYVEKVPGFTVVGEAGTGTDALRLIATTRPDLLLLDIYLPDISGLEVLRTIRETGTPRVDVIAITAARDVQSLRSAMQGGVVHYLIKPFRFAALQEKLQSYAAMRQRLAQLSEADQHAVDTLYHILRHGSAETLPKGLSRPTLDLVTRILHDASHDLAAAEVAELASLSRVTARRYLDYMVQFGRVEVVMRYGSPGRPEHRYHLVTAGMLAGQAPPEA